MSGFEPGSSGGSDNSKWPLWAPRVGPGSTGVFGALVYQDTQGPGSVTRRIFPPKFSSGASRLPRGLGLGTEERRERGAVATPYSPILWSAPNPTTMLGVDES